MAKQAVLKSNKGLSLIEVLITVAILSGAIVFVFRSFTASLNSAKFSQNITIACFLAEDKILDIEQRQLLKTEALAADSGIETIQGRDFNWNYSAELDDYNLAKTALKISWKEKAREKDYEIEFFGYITPEAQ